MSFNAKYLINFVCSFKLFETLESIAMLTKSDASNGVKLLKGIKNFNFSKTELEQISRGINSYQFTLDELWAIFTDDLFPSKGETKTSRLIGSSLGWNHISGVLFGGDSAKSDKRTSNRGERTDSFPIFTLLYKIHQILQTERHAHNYNDNYLPHRLTKHELLKLLIKIVDEIHNAQTEVGSSGDPLGIQQMEKSDIEGIAELPVSEMEHVIVGAFTRWARLVAFIRMQQLLLTHSMTEPEQPKQTRIEANNFKG